ncbi:hypothetical protein G9A89_000014 [Geosiphon pyriformis]|nr:hypothetical protein G9A89_000014 [Geosiphon pyriformis]
MKKWLTLDADKALVIIHMVQAGKKQMDILKHLSFVKSEYRKSKMYESKLVEKVSIRNAIKKCMEKFCLDKGGMIKSVLDHLFYKVVLDHLVIDDELVLKPKKVKSDVNKIMEGWTRKCSVLLVLSDQWAHQYTPLDYVRDDAFSNMMCTINISELKRLDSRSPVSHWFVLTSRFLNDESSFKSVLADFSLPLPSLCISNSKKFLDIWDSLHEVWSGNFEIYTDSSLKNAGSAGVMCKAAAYFLALDIGVDVGV